MLFEATFDATELGTYRGSRGEEEKAPPPPKKTRFLRQLSRMPVTLTSVPLDKPALLLVCSKHCPVQRGELLSSLEINREVGRFLFAYPPSVLLLGWLEWKIPSKQTRQKRSAQLV